MPPCLFLSWAALLFTSLYLFSQPYLHWWGCSFKWTLIIWLFNVNLFARPFPHWLQWNLFSSSRWCLLSICSFSFEKVPPQSGHTSCICTFLWFDKKRLFLKDFPHVEHWHGSSSCCFLWSAILCTFTFLLHNWQISIRWLNLWLVSSSVVWKNFMQSSQPW